MIVVIIGIVFAILGLVGLVSWWDYFVVIVKGVMPFLLVIGGLLTAIAGITGMKDKSDIKTISQPDEDKK